MEQKLIIEIDKAHKEANQALKNKDFTTYARAFSNNLRYKQLNGAIIGKEQLTKSIKTYFSRIQEFSSDYERKEFKVINEAQVVEKLIQHSKVSIRIFIFFSKKWNIEREGIYEWEKTNNLWKIVRVTIINESVA